MTSPSPMSRQKLFLPGLSGLTQGPGFPNLSCLGLLSDPILGVDFTAAERPIRRSDEHQPIRRRQRHFLPVGQRTAPPCLLTVFAPREDASGRERAAPVRGSDAGPGRIPGPGAPHPIPGSALATPEIVRTDNAAKAAVATKVVAVLRNTVLWFSNRVRTCASSRTTPIVPLALLGVCQVRVDVGRRWRRAKACQGRQSSPAATTRSAATGPTRQLGTACPYRTRARAAPSCSVTRPARRGANRPPDRRCPSI